MQVKVKKLKYTSFSGEIMMFAIVLSLFLVSLSYAIEHVPLLHVTTIDNNALEQFFSITTEQLSLDDLVKSDDVWAYLAQNKHPFFSTQELRALIKDFTYLMSFNDSICKKYKAKITNQFNSFFHATISPDDLMCKKSYNDFLTGSQDNLSNCIKELS